MESEIVLYWTYFHSSLLFLQKTFLSQVYITLENVWTELIYDSYVTYKKTSEAETTRDDGKRTKPVTVAIVVKWLACSKCTREVAGSNPPDDMKCYLTPRPLRSTLLWVSAAKCDKVWFEWYRLWEMRAFCSYFYISWEVCKQSWEASVLSLKAHMGLARSTTHKRRHAEFCHPCNFWIFWNTSVYKTLMLLCLGSGYGYIFEITASLNPYSQTKYSWNSTQGRQTSEVA